VDQVRNGFWHRYAMFDVLVRGESFSGCFADVTVKKGPEDEGLFVEDSGERG
jgi:hypothetical protein